MTEWNETGIKTYQIKQVDDAGLVLNTVDIEAESSEAAAKKLRQVVDGALHIKVCLNDAVMNEMGVDYWLKRVRRR